MIIITIEFSTLKIRNMDEEQETGKEWVTPEIFDLDVEKTTVKQNSFNEGVTYGPIS